MPDIQKKKRKAMSIQDTANLPNITDDMMERPKRRSSYSGPKKAAGSTAASRNAQRAAGKSGSTYVNTIDGYGYAGDRGTADRSVSKSGFETMAAGKGRAKGSGKPQKSSGGYVAPFTPAGITAYAWIPYCVVLAFCLMVSMIVAGRKMATGEGYYIPRQMLSSTGILNTIYDEYYSGGLGSDYAASQGTAATDGTATDASADGTASDSSTGTDAAAGETGSTAGTSSVNTITGATMALDDGSAYGTYTNATTHEEVVEQVSEALAAGDSGFVGRKLAYTDENSNQLIGYPQSVVEHFTTYMSENSDKRESFISEISGEDYAADYNGAQIIKLPLLKFTVNMGYDDTKLSISGFSDQTLNAGQSATVQPLLPCMYTISVSTNGGSQSSEVEANMNEGNLQINIGVSDAGANKSDSSTDAAADSASTADSADTTGTETAQ